MCIRYSTGCSGANGSVGSKEYLTRTRYHFCIWIFVTFGILHGYPYRRTFNVRPDNVAKEEAAATKVEMRMYRVIYDAINDIKDAIEGMLEPVMKEEIVASVEVMEIFKISKVGTVAGCIVREGKLTRNTPIRVIRDGIVIYTGKLGSLKRFKDDVKEVTSGQDCGLNIESFNDVKIGDIIEGYEQVEVKRTK
mgnify:CR=1 FL=1